MSTECDVPESDFMFDPTMIQNRGAGDAAFEVRPLRVSDYSRNYLQLLEQLTTVGNVDYESFESRFNEMRDSKMYFVIVIEDKESERIVASTTLFLEFKFIHSNALRGRIEDVVVDDSARGKGLGKLVVKKAIELARSLKCYKLSLDCRDQMIAFYESLGFVAEVGRSNMLVIRMEQ